MDIDNVVENLRTPSIKEIQNKGGNLIIIEDNIKKETNNKDVIVTIIDPSKNMIKSKGRSRHMATVATKWQYTGGIHPFMGRWVT